MKVFNLKKMLEEVMLFVAHNAPDGANGGAPSSTPAPDGGTGAPPTAPPAPTRGFKGLQNIPDDILDDPDMVNAANDFNTAQKDDTPSPAPDADPKADDKNNDGKPADDGKKVDDKPVDDAEITFENDVVVGDVTFSKDLLNKTPIEFVESVGKLKERLDAATQEVVSNKEKHDKLLNDPIVRDRQKRIQEGTADKPYSAYGVSKETDAAVRKALDDAGLEESEIGKVMDVLKKEISVDVEDNVQSYVRNALAKADQEAAQAKVVENGKAAIENLAKMHKDLNKDKVYQWCTNPARRGTGHNGALSYRELTDMVDRFGIETVYTAIAKDLKLPVVLNAGERDKKIVAGERERLLNLMGAKTVKKALSTQSKNSGVPGQKAASILDDGAIDDDKLHDTEYTGALLDGAGEVEDIFRTQELLKSRIMNKK